MYFADALTLDAPKRTADGYMAVRARAARTGVYDYLAGEIGAPDSFKPGDTVKVYRDAADVFDAESVRSFIGRPITNDHPSAPVTASNWRDHARGAVMGAMRDGDYLAFDLVLMDAAAISAVDAGKRELSNGYSCTLDWTPGAAPDGQRYDARQTGIRGNHVALVDAGRAGPNCAIKDGDAFAICDANPAAMADLTMKGNSVKKIVLDGLQVDLADADAVAAAISKLQDQISAGAKSLTDARTQISTLTGEKAVLDKQVADLKAQLEPAALDQRVANRAKLVADAKRILPSIVTDAMDENAIRRAVVNGKLGDAAKDMDDAAVAGAYVALLTGCEDAKPTDDKAVHNIAPAAVADAAATRNILRTARFA